jgi:hypothetical protein
VNTAPQGATVSALVVGQHEPRKLGKAPVKVSSLVIVRKRYPDGTVDYWLRDPRAVLPRNDEKPGYASPAYAAGSDYPLDLYLYATWAGSPETAEHLRLGRFKLASLFDAPDPTIQVTLSRAQGGDGSLPQQK